MSHFPIPAPICTPISYNQVVMSYLKLYVFQKIKMFSKLLDIFLKLGVMHVVWKIFWEREVWEAHHLFARVGEY